MLDLAVDVDVDELGSAHHDAVQVDTTEPGVDQVDGTELRPAEVDPLKPGVAEIRMHEISHVATLPSYLVGPLTP